MYRTELVPGLRKHSTCTAHRALLTKCLGHSGASCGHRKLQVAAVKGLSHALRNIAHCCCQSAESLQHHTHTRVLYEHFIKRVSRRLHYQTHALLLSLATSSSSRPAAAGLRRLARHKHALAIVL